MDKENFEERDSLTPGGLPSRESVIDLENPETPGAQKDTQNKRLELPDLANGKLSKTTNRMSKLPHLMSHIKLHFDD